MRRNDQHGPAMKLHRSPRFGEVSKAGLGRQTTENVGLQPIGTLVAKNTLALGEAANMGVMPDGSERANRERCSQRTEGGSVGRGRGGARNKTYRISEGLTGRQVTNLVDAVEHAARVNLPLNRMVTVHWQAAGVPPKAMSRATGRFLDLLSKTLKRHGSSTAWVWVHENGDDKGGHCHLLVHVPSSLVRYISCRQRSWLKRITGKPYKRRTILSRPVGGLLGLEVGNPDLHALNLRETLNYLIKGTDQQTAEVRHLTRLQAAGPVYGKRCGTSQNIGCKARKDYHGQQ